MKEWSETDWFQNWLALARQGQIATLRAQGFTEIPSGLLERKASPCGESAQHAPSAELQVTE